MKGKFTYRLKYEKLDSVRYISHLDFVRVLNRTVRRSGFPITYTEGFNPHPVMTVAMPISVGVTSECEYMDIDFDDKFDDAVVMDGFNKAFPSGIRVIAVKCLDENDVKFKRIDSAVHQVKIEMKNETAPDVAAFMANDEIIIMKKSKSSKKEVDIKPYIYKLELTEHDGKYITLLIQTPAGNTYNLKPELVVAAMEKYVKGFEVKFLQTHRVALLANNEPLM